MSTTNTTIEEALASVAKLEKSLEASRGDTDAAKRAHREQLASIAGAIGLPTENPTTEAIVSALADVEKTIGERTAAITAERDEANARAAKVEAEWNAFRIDAALREAFTKSGAREEHYEDFRNLAGALFHVDPKTGKVVTRPDAPNTIPGAEPLAFIHGELKSRRAFWWPLSTGGHARAPASPPPTPAGDTSCFKPGPTWNLTRQFAYEAQYGAAAAEAARRRYGGVR